MSNKTGHYVWDSESKKFIKVSNKASIKSRVWFPRKCTHSGHKFENLDKTFYSAKEKREYMQSKNIAEAG